MGIPFLNDIDMKNNLIINLGTPINDNDATNKLYVDNSINTLKNNLETQLVVQKDELTNTFNTELETLNVNLSNKITTVEQSITSIIDGKIIDNLDTPSSEYALSANQGTILKNMITASFSTSNTYSAEPVVIGSWFDSTLYRIVVNHICDDSTTQDLAINIPFMSSYSVPINVYGFYKTPENKIAWFGHHKNVGAITDGIYVVDYDKENYLINLYLSPNTHTLATQGLELNLIVEYAEIITIEEPPVEG